MKSLHIVLFLLAMLISLIIADSQTPYKKSQIFTAKNPATSPYSESEVSASLRGSHGHKNGRASGVMTCDEYPRVCGIRGSEGPDCCKKRCVNVSTDRNNCGKCGKRCEYSEMCCRGKCLNTMFDKHHCGGCGNKCKKGNSCVHGMCNYA